MANDGNCRHIRSQRRRENGFVAPHQFGERRIAFDRIGIDKFQEGKEAAITFVFHPGSPQSFSLPWPLLLTRIAILALGR